VPSTSRTVPEKSLASDLNRSTLHTRVHYHTVKKEYTIFLIFKEIQKEAVAKSYMRKGFLIYEKAVSHI
jgi:hypothetical protein